MDFGSLLSASPLRFSLDKQQGLLLLLRLERRQSMKTRSRGYHRLITTRHQMGTNVTHHWDFNALVRQNKRLAKRLVAGQSEGDALCRLYDLTVSFGMSIALGDLLYLHDRWYVTHAGLLRLAYRTHCASIRVKQVREYCDPSVSRWVFRATVNRTPRSKSFVGYGDADPSNVSPIVRGAEMRVAETRAVNRALRKAYGIGLCSVEELGSHPFSAEPSKTKSVEPPNGNGSSNGRPRLRDKLCLLIRNYELDPTLVKRYAADFCGTETLRDASRDLIEAFVSTLAEEGGKQSRRTRLQIEQLQPT
jgi:hypothetical protein